MTLFHIEYHLKSGQTYICKVIGTSENDVVRDIVSQVGEIRVLSIYHQSEVHRITETVRRQIIEGSLKGKKSHKMGRPRKYDL